MMPKLEITTAATGNFFRGVPPAPGAHFRKNYSSFFLNHVEVLDFVKIAETEI
jgi:hypothetical protein